MQNQVAISGKFDKSHANLVENSKVQPNYTQDLMALAQQIQDSIKTGEFIELNFPEFFLKADKSIQSNVTNKLNIIIEQIQFLQDQARGILEKAKLEKELHAAACNVLKRPGQLYFYYVRSSGQKYLSIMSPQDWGDKCPHEFLGAYRLEYDNSWTLVNDIVKVDERKALIQQVMNKTLAIKDALN